MQRDDGFNVEWMRCTKYEILNTQLALLKIFLLLVFSDFIEQIVRKDDNLERWRLCRGQ